MSNNFSSDAVKREILLRVISENVREIDEHVRCLSGVRGPRRIRDLPMERLTELALAHNEMRLAISKVNAAWAGAATEEGGEQ